MTTSALRVEIIEGQLAVITFDQPGSRANVMSQGILGEFENIMKEIEGRKDLRGLILRSGKPGMFIAGADLKELGSQLAQRKLELMEQMGIEAEEAPAPQRKRSSGSRSTRASSSKRRQARAGSRGKSARGSSSRARH